MFVDGVEAEQPTGRQCVVHAGNAGLQSCELAAVVDGIQEAGDQIDRLADCEATHVLPGEPSFRTANSCPVQHRLVDVEPAAFKSRVDEIPHMRTGATGEIQVPAAAIAEQLLQI